MVSPTDLHRLRERPSHRTRTKAVGKSAFSESRHPDYRDSFHLGKIFPAGDKSHTDLLIKYLYPLNHDFSTGIPSTTGDLGFCSVKCKATPLSRNWLMAVPVPFDSSTPRK